MNILKLFYSVRYTRVDQLFARFKLLVKRKFSEKFADSLNKKFESSHLEFSVVEDIPTPIFNKRRGSFEVLKLEKEAFKLTFLNETHSFQVPIDWHPKKLEYGTRLWKLNLHYHEFLEEVDDEWFELILIDWIDQNPPYKKGYWLDSWNSFALSIRVVVWMQQLAFRKISLSKEFEDRVNRSLFNQLQFLYSNLEEDIRGNHIIKNIKALLWGSKYFKSNQQVEHWERKCHQLLKDELETQILIDGFHFERSPAYHGQVFGDLLECYHVMNAGRLKSELSAKLEKMALVMSKVTHPDGKYSLFNDGGLDMAYSPGELIKKSEELLGIKVESSNKINLPEAGYFGLKTKNNLFLYDAGKIAPDTLPAHGHGDIFSFEWSIDGQRVFIDKGVYEYNAGERRSESRSTNSHNTVNIDGNDQCEFWGAFRVARRANVEVLERGFDTNSMHIKARHDGYKRLEGSPIHQRSINFSGYRLLIEDEVVGGNGQSVEARFLIHPDVEVIKGQNTVILRLSEKEIKLESEGDMTVIDSVWFPNFGVEERCKQIIVKYGACPLKSNCKFLIE